MSLSSSQRRDQRRRLVVSWKRSAGEAVAPAAESPRSMAAYDPEAHPERQRGPAVLLPTGLGGFCVAVVGIMLPLVAAIAAAAGGPLVGRDLFVGGGRFARTVAALGSMCDPRGVAALHAWIAQTYLLAAAAVAVIVRLMRRHRRDDFKGRFRAWGWMAVVLVTTALAGSVPLGRLVSAALTDATGMVLGPSGAGWWIALATVVLGAVSLWAVLPLHERLATASWLTVALVAWGISAAGTLLADRRPWIPVVAAAAWSLASGLALVAMLAAARSVIREVRGQCTTPTPKAAKPRRTAAATPAEREPARDDEVDSSAFEPVEPVAGGNDAETEFVDGSEPDQRHLSKAEKKRLRKLARMNGAAA